MADINQYPVRQNFHSESEEGINKQINTELYAFYSYLSLAYYFQRFDVALPGFHKFFKNRSQEELEHAQMFMDYQNQRGGSILLQPLNKPAKDKWGSTVEAMETALQLERSVNDSILELHKLALKNGDGHFEHFLKQNFLVEQVEDIKYLSDQVTTLKRAGPGQGELMIDREYLKQAESS